MKNVFVLGAVLGFTMVSACSSHGRKGQGGSDLSHHGDGFAFDDGGNVITDDGGFDTGDGGSMTHDPTTCAEAATSKSYIGCDYWPTVTANAVWSVFDYAVVVSNPGSTTVNVTVSGGALSASKAATVAPGQLTYIALPWVPSLKGKDADSQGRPTQMTASVYAAKGAYHLVADAPVLVYQFNALEYKAGTGNDLNGTPWSTCPASGSSCKSYSNDASLLLPSTAMTNNYVITGLSGNDFAGSPYDASYAVITATADATTVIVQLSATADLIASSGNTKIPKTPRNKNTPAKVTFTLDAGDVLELLTSIGSTYDLTGSIVQSTAPVQVVVGNACTSNPNDGMSTCDHIEETVLPVQTWGKQYVVTGPTGPNGDKPGHTVRIYGGIADSTLTYTPTVSGAPATIKAGTVTKFDTATDFVVSGTTEFVVSSEQKSGDIVDPSNFFDPQGDPSLSFMVAVPQYRDKYLFLAPTDYATSFVDVAMPDGTALMLDGAAVTQGVAFVGGGFSVVRIPLSGGNNGAHTLTGTAPFGIQVVGYGSQTSYQYPGGLDLKVISNAPPPIN